MLGRGAFGQVFRARWRGTECAVKQIKLKSDAALEEFEREVAVNVKLHHPNVLMIMGVSEKMGDDGHVSQVFIVSELMPHG